MCIRQILKRSDTVVGLVRDSRKIFRKSNPPSRIIKSYMESHEIKKLQIGAGPTVLDGWLCTDIDPKCMSGVMYLDAMKPFPFDSATIDYVYSEHMIEHISWQDGLVMLQECLRVLKPGGTIRIATPDLAVLIGLYSRNGEAMNERYIDWITNRSLDGVNVSKASFVINNAFRNWGHQFLYDAELLEMAMQEVGFTNIRRYSVGESEDENLRDIESHGSNVDDNDMVAFETMVFEGKREL